MQYQKETLAYSAVLSVTALVFIMLPVLKGNLSIGAINIALSLLVYFVLGFVGFWLGQKVSGYTLLLKSIYWAAPMCFFLPYQVSKFTGINETFPAAHFLLVVAAAFLVGLRINQVTVDKDRND